LSHSGVKSEKISVERAHYERAPAPQSDATQPVRWAALQLRPPKLDSKSSEASWKISQQANLDTSRPHARTYSILLYGYKHRIVNAQAKFILLSSLEAL
jgi:hypothetical protein